LTDKLKVEKLTVNKKSWKDILKDKRIWIIVGVVVILLVVAKFTVLKSDKTTESVSTSTTEATTVLTKEVKTN